MSTIGQSRKTALEADLVTSLVQELQRAERHAAELERQLANREFDVRALEARVQAVEAEAARRVADAERNAAEAHQRLLALYRSTSWRLMGPFRRAVRLARRLFGRGQASAD